MAGQPVGRLLVDVGRATAEVVVAGEAVQEPADRDALRAVAAEPPQKVADLGAALLGGDEGVELVADEDVGVGGGPAGGEGVGALGVEVGERERQLGGHRGPSGDRPAQPGGVRAHPDHPGDAHRAQRAQQHDGDHRAQSQPARPGRAARGPRRDTALRAGCGRRGPGAGPAVGAAGRFVT